MDLLDKQRPVLFTLPYTISAQDQQAIIDYAYSHAPVWSGQVQVWDDQRDQYEQTDYFGRVQITRLTEASRQRLTSDPKYTSDWLNWAARLDPTLEWEWIDTPITHILKRYVDGIRHLYKCFNRVLILVQKPGSEIPMHTDKATMNAYSDGEFTPGPVATLGLEANDRHWQDNRYLTLKFPLTERPGDNGCPVIDLGLGQGPQRYDVVDRLFAINEVDVMHGARAVNHRRGVIFLDGLLDYEALCRETWQEVPLHEIH